MRKTFSGTVLIAKGDEILFTKACGEASKRFHVANNLETKFNLGSIVAVMSNYDNGASPLAGRIKQMVGSVEER